MNNFTHKDTFRPPVFSIQGQNSDRSAAPVLQVSLMLGIWGGILVWIYLMPTDLAINILDMFSPSNGSCKLF